MSTASTATRLECLRIAAMTPGDPNKVQTAQKYYEFVTEQDGAKEAPVLTVKGGKEKK